MEVENKEFFS